MKRNWKILSLVAVLTLSMALVWAGLAGAHSRKTAAGMNFVVGGTDEPVITGIRSWMEVTITDATTGEGVTGLEADDKLTMTVSNGEWSRKVTMQAVRGKAGAYKVPIWFVEAGTYDFIITGTTADGTPFEVKEHKDIADHRELFFPPVGK